MSGALGTAVRRKTPTVEIGRVKVGSGHPVVVQSMTNTDTEDAAATARQVAELARAGSELVRITVNTLKAAEAVPAIAERLEMMACDVPLIGDFHYNGHTLLEKVPECARILAKYRINPGNVGAKRRDENFRTIVELAAAHGKPVRIGVNWGSLDQALLTEGSPLADPNRFAKRREAFAGVFRLPTDELDYWLGELEVSAVWGIGRQYTKLLNQNGVFTAWQLRDLCDRWVKRNMTIVGLRTVWELRGISCIARSARAAALAPSPLASAAHPSERPPALVGCAGGCAASGTERNAS